MSNKQFKSALRRLRNGIPIYIKKTTGPHKQATFRVQYNGRAYLGVIFVHTDCGDSYVEEVWETRTIDLLRRIACGYYPSLCKHFGPARQFAGV